MEGLIHQARIQSVLESSDDEKEDCDSQKLKKQKLKQQTMLQAVIHTTAASDRNLSGGDRSDNEAVKQFNNRSLVFISLGSADNDEDECAELILAESNHIQESPIASKERTDHSKAQRSDEASSSSEEMILLTGVDEDSVNETCDSSGYQILSKNTNVSESETASTVHRGNVTSTRSTITKETIDSLSSCDKADFVWSTDDFNRVYGDLFQDDDTVNDCSTTVSENDLLVEIDSTDDETIQNNKSNTEDSSIGSDDTDLEILTDIFFHAMLKLMGLVEIFRARQKLLKARAAAIKIQSCVRGYLMWVRYVEFEGATIVLQAHFRRRMTIELQCARECAAAKIQSTVRRRACKAQMDHRRLTQALRKELETRRQHGAAIQIQRCFRGSAVRSEMILRRLKLAKVAYLNIVAGTRIALELQSLARGRQCRLRYLHIRRVIVTLQSLRRRKLAMQKLTRFRLSVLFDDIFLRYYLASFRNNRNYHRNTSAISLQKVTRGQLCRQLIERNRTTRFDTAVMLQKHQRRVACKKQLDNALSSIILLQRNLRCWMVFALYKHQINSITRIQASLRTHLHRTRHEKLRLASVVLQRQFKSQSLYRFLQDRSKSSTVVQKYARAWQARKFFIMSRSAICIQTMTRSKYHKKQFMEARSSAILIQQHWRGSWYRYEWKRKLQAAIILQNHFRRWTLSQSVLKATRIIQTTASAFLYRKRFQVLQHAALSIQCRTRASFCKKRFDRLVHCILLLQKQIRLVIAKRQYCETRRSLLFIQACTRRSLQQNRFKAVHFVASCLQREFRRQKARRVVLKMLDKIRHLQAYTKGRIQKSKFTKMKKTATIIQAVWRCHLAQKKHQTNLMKLRKVQAHARKSNALSSFRSKRTSAILVQAKIRSFLIRQRVVRKEAEEAEAARDIQKVWRKLVAFRKYNEKCSSLERIIPFCESTEKEYSQDYSQTQESHTCDDFFCKRETSSCDLGEMHTAKYPEKHLIVSCDRQEDNGYRAESLQSIPNAVEDDNSETDHCSLNSTIFRNETTPPRLKKLIAKDSALVTKHWSVFKISLRWSFFGIVAALISVMALFSYRRSWPDDSLNQLVSNKNADRSQHMDHRLVTDEYLSSSNVHNVLPDLQDGIKNIAPQDHKSKQPAKVANSFSKRPLRLPMQETSFPFSNILSDSTKNTLCLKVAESTSRTELCPDMLRTKSTSPPKRSNFEEGEKAEESSVGAQQEEVHVDTTEKDELPIESPANRVRGEAMGNEVSPSESRFDSKTIEIAKNPNLALIYEWEHALF